VYPEIEIENDACVEQEWEYYLHYLEEGEIEDIYDDTEADA